MLISANIGTSTVQGSVQRDAKLEDVYAWLGKVYVRNTELSRARGNSPRKTIDINSFRKGVQVLIVEG